MPFTPGGPAPVPSSLPPLWFVVDQGRILVRRTPEGTLFPETADLAEREALSGVALGHMEGRPCLMAHGDAEAPVADDLEWMELRALFGAVDETTFWTAGRASHLAGWDRNTRFCGACGTPLALDGQEWSKTCGACGRIAYPRISPAVIMAVVDGDRILLARGSRSPRPWFSVLAGFVEPGEDLESTVRREIREEVGLSVGRLRYFGSQPWPFPDSLMIGFMAEYAGGEICIDPAEIQEARWFHREALPEIPPSLSISRKLIEAFRDGGA